MIWLFFSVNPFSQYKLLLLVLFFCILGIRDRGAHVVTVGFPHIYMFESLIWWQRCLYFVLFCLHQLWTSSSAGRQLINKSNSVSIYKPFQLSVCDSERVLAAAGGRAANVWRSQVTPVPPALPAQPAGAVEPTCAWGVSDPNDLYTLGHRVFCRLPLWRPYSQSHI